MDDKLLKRLVEDELQYQPSIDAADIGVTVEEGIVHLSGHIANFAQKTVAEAAVKRVKGVRGYVDDLAVRPGPDIHSDEAIAARVANLLEWDVTLPRGVIQVQVAGGFVTLMGEVEWAYQRYGAESSVRRLPGVRGLVNKIVLKPKVHAADVKRRIEQALERQAEIEADGISVVVEGSKVQLDGKVRAWFERGIVERAAWAAPGVDQVEDRLTVAGA